MTSRADGRGRMYRRALSAQARNRTAELVREEAARLDGDIRLAMTALSAIGNRARVLSRNSARVRTLGLEAFPDSDYLAYCVQALRAELDSPRAFRRRRARTRARADEVRALLERAIALTAAIDIPGELGLTLDIVTATQTGARAGLASLARLHDTLEAVETEHHAADRAAPGDTRPSRPAQWLAHTASRLLPAGSRERYGEEFSSELRELADTHAGCRAQLAHAIRLFSRAWALRNALPASAPPPPAEPDRVRAHPRADSGAVRLRAGRRGPLNMVGRWVAHHEARVVMRQLAKVQRRQGHAVPHDRAGHPRRITVNYRHRHR